MKHEAVEQDVQSYQAFWDGVGRDFPDLGGAASTRMYAADEQWLLATYLSPGAGMRLFKTDLWDEAKNTRILRWAAGQGAAAYGIDISRPVVSAARQQFEDSSLDLRAVVSDVRWLPFADASFDAIYSMGTIEHFDDTIGAVRELVRVLRPGGRAIIGVPNRHDPFLRPLLANALQAMGRYAYGFEKCYSRRALRSMLESSGLQVVAESGILFIPGWLRMLDLACHSWIPFLSRVTAAAVWPFAWASRRFPWLRRHGYLLATVAVRPRT